MSIRTDPFRRIVLDINGKHANGTWTYDKQTGLTIDADWGPGPKQRATITIGAHNAVELLFALMAPAADQLALQRQNDVESHYRQQDLQRRGYA